jgi:hypothetical protein
MSSSSESEIGVNDITKKIHEKQLVVKFDYLKRQDKLQLKALILQMLGFGIVIIVGVNPDEARIGDVVMEIAHNGFCTCAQVWMNIKVGIGGWETT